MCLALEGVHGYKGKAISKVCFKNNTSKGFNASQDKWSCDALSKDRIYMVKYS
jgi:hypothetical protein